MFVENESFRLTNRTSNFASMGLGYYLFFLIAKMAIIFSVIPFGLTATYFLYFNYTGNDCIPSKYNKKFEESKLRLLESSEKFLENLNNLDIIKKNSYYSSNLKNIQKENFHKGEYSLDMDKDLKLTENENDNLKIFMSLYCESRIIVDDSDCKLYYKKNCQKKNSKFCKKISQKKYLKKFNHNHCVDDWINKGTVGNIASQMNNINSKRYWRNLTENISLIIALILTIVFSFIENSKSTRIDRRITSVGDYSIQIMNLPKENNDEVDLKDKIMEVFERKGFEVEQINFAFDMDEYIKLREEYADLKVKMFKNDFKKNLGELLGHHLEADELSSLGLVNETQEDFKKKKQLKEKIKNQERLYDEGDSNKFVGQAFVSFKYKKQKEEVLDQFGIKKSFLARLCSICSSKGLSLDFNGKETILKIYDAPEPNDIIWKNLSYSYFSKFIRSLVSNSVTLSIVIGSFFLLIYVDVALVIFLVFNHFFVLNFLLILKNNFNEILITYAQKRSFLGPNGPRNIFHIFFSIKN